MQTSVDLIIEARWIIPIEPANVVLENHSVIINKGRIVAILQQDEANSLFCASQTKKLANHILIPGLVNLHSHAAMSLLRGLADDLPIVERLEKHIWLAEAKHISAQFVLDGTRLACAEMLRGGTTCFNDMYFYPKAVAEAAVSSGIRAAIGLITVDFPTAYASDADDYLAKGLSARDELINEPLLSFCLAPHAPYTVNDRNFTQALTLAEQCEIPIHLHLHETKQEIEDSRQSYGIRPIERLHRLGLLSPGLIGAHGIHLSNEEISLLAQHGCSIAHCPSSNLKLASGMAPIAELIERGVNVGIGTDGAANNNRLDMFQEMRLAALPAKAVSGQTQAVNAHQALRMATLAGAQALGLENTIGSIVKGKAADLCAVRINDVSLVPCYDAASLLVYSAGREHVTDVWVNGTMRVADGELLQAKEIELIKLAALWQNQICPRDV